MQWFVAEAPIRTKLVVAFGSMIGVMILLAAISFFESGWMTAAVDVVAIVIAAVMAVKFRAAIADPYVATVVRMEGLAAGDLQSDIAYTDYKDCVGRMTQAMLTFRDAAVEQQRQAAEQAVVVSVVSDHLARLRTGDLTALIDQPFPPAYAALRDNYNLTVQELRELISAVSESSGTIECGVNEIAQASEDLAKRTEVNAADLEETTSAIAQMADRLNQTAEAASRTVERADAAIRIISEGRTVADEAVSAMGRVSDSATGIDSVIEGLDKIAFQTRVLAMNAAVEAGRAGEAGRGFAVVADLVSALAKRAEEEAGRARVQLTTTQAEIGSAVEMVRRVDGALLGISDDVAVVHNLLASMAQDNSAQASAIGEINATVGSMDRATQQNAAMVEETSAAASNLANEAAQLTQAAGRFDMGPISPGTGTSGSAWNQPDAYLAPKSARSSTGRERAMAH